MNSDPLMVSYEHWSFDTQRGLLFVDGEMVRLQRGVLKLLQFLVNHEGSVVTKEDLVEKVWDGRDISDAAMYNRVSALRKALGDDKSSERCIEWEYGRGLRFLRPGGLPQKQANEVRAVTPSNRREGIVSKGTGSYIAEAPVENWRHILGVYNTIYRTPSWPGTIKVGVSVLREADGKVVVWTSERGEDPKVGTRQRAKYLGTAVFVNGRVYVEEQNSEPPHSICLTTLDAPHSYRPDIMKGLMHGSSWRLGGAPYATRVIWQRLAPPAGVREALEKSGPYPENTELIEPAILKSIGPDCLTFYDEASFL